MRSISDARVKPTLEIVRLLSMLVAIALLILPGCSSDRSDPDHQIQISGQEGRTVFELLRASHAVEYDSSAMGIFIKAIDGKRNSGGHYWIYYVNGEPGQVACDKARVSVADTITWRYR